jgi:hypothetical protein
VSADCPLFNSAHGAVFNVAGKNELETSLMLSRPPAARPDIPASRRGTALTLLTRAKNPSQLARALYLAPAEVEHPFLSGATAEDIGAKLGAELVDPSYFFTEMRWREHRRGLGLPEEPLPDGRAPGSPEEPIPGNPLDVMPTGTVGAVALDVRGALCAVTSTGGKTNKLVGRIGDTPQMGAGFWAAEWAVRGHFRRAWRRLVGKRATRAVGISGTGDGDVRFGRAARRRRADRAHCSTSSARTRRRRSRIGCSSYTSPSMPRPRMSLGTFTRTAGPAASSASTATAASHSSRTARACTAASFVRTACPRRRSSLTTSSSRGIRPCILLLSEPKSDLTSSRSHTRAGQRASPNMNSPRRLIVAQTSHARLTMIHALLGYREVRICFSRF